MLWLIFLVFKMIDIFRCRFQIRFDYIFFLQFEYSNWDSLIFVFFMYFVMSKRAYHRKQHEVYVNLILDVQRKTMYQNMAWNLDIGVDTFYPFWIYMFSLFGFFIIARNQIDAIRTENALDTFAYKWMINFLYKYLLLVSSVKFVLIYTCRICPNLNAYTSSIHWNTTNVAKTTLSRSFRANGKIKPEKTILRWKGIFVDLVFMEHKFWVGSNDAETKGITDRNSCLLSRHTTPYALTV